MSRIAMADATRVLTAGRANASAHGRGTAPLQFWLVGAAPLRGVSRDAVRGGAAALRTALPHAGSACTAWRRTVPSHARGRRDGPADGAQGGRSGLSALLAAGLLGVLTLLPGGSLHAQVATSAPEPKGMPQFDFGNPLLLSQIVWGAVIFALFYVLAARWALPQMAVVLERRQELIAADLETARHAKGEADAAVRELTEARRSSHAEAQRAIDAATAQAKTEAAEATAAMNARLDAQLAEAEGRIAAARGQAMGALREVATETAQLVVSRLISRPADAGRVQSAVDAVLAERSAAAA